MLNFYPVLIGVLLLAGCSLHQPQKVGLPSEIPEQYLEQPSAVNKAASPERWWLSFNDPQLDLLMNELFAENLMKSTSLDLVNKGTLFSLPF